MFFDTEDYSEYETTHGGAVGDDGEDEFPEFPVQYGDSSDDDIIGGFSIDDGDGDGDEDEDRDVADADEDAADGADAADAIDTTSPFLETVAETVGGVDEKSPFVEEFGGEDFDAEPDGEPDGAEPNNTEPDDVSPFTETVGGKPAKKKPAAVPPSETSKQIKDIIANMISSI